MSYFKEFKCQSTVILALPTSASDKDRMELLSRINSAVREAFVDLRKEDVNFLPLEVTTTLESME
jgi:hypothetical protein